MSRWKVQFRSTNPHWAARFPDHFDFSTVWGEIPWDDYLTERETDDEGSQHLADRLDAFKDVRLFTTGDSQWIEAAPPAQEDPK